MSSTHVPHESRRSTRVRLKVVISTAVPLRVGMKIQIHVLMMNTRAAADVVYIDPERPRVCGIGLVIPENIWGVEVPPSDWHENAHES